jgi:hypothetical protein
MLVLPVDVSAVIPTRGDVDLSKILKSIADAGITDTVVWDNSKRENLKVFARYAAMAECKNDVVYVQDDDIFLPHTTIEGIIEAYEPGVITANMSEGWARGRNMLDAVQVGAGAVLDRSIPPKAFAKYDTIFPRDDFFYLYTDVLVAIPSRIKRVDLPLEVLPWGYAPNRMNAFPDFDERFQESLARGRAVRDAFGGKE